MNSGANVSRSIRDAEGKAAEHERRYTTPLAKSEKQDESLHDIPTTLTSKAARHNDATCEKPAQIEPTVTNEVRSSDDVSLAGLSKIIQQLDLTVDLLSKEVKHAHDANLVIPLGSTTKSKPILRLRMLCSDEALKSKVQACDEVKLVRDDSPAVVPEHAKEIESACDTASSDQSNPFSSLES